MADRKKPNSADGPPLESDRQFLGKDRDELVKVYTRCRAPVYWDTAVVSLWP